MYEEYQERDQLLPGKWVADGFNDQPDGFAGREKRSGGLGRFDVRNIGQFFL